MTATAASFRRHADNVVLRWQARFDSEWSDRVLPWLFSGGLFVLLVLPALAKVRSFDSSVGFASFTQGAWLIHHGQAPVLTMTTGVNVLADHAAIAFYPISLTTFLLPTPAALVVVQSAALALAVVPIWRIARRLANLRVGAAFTLIVVYALYPVMHNLNLSGFYPESVALPALLFAAYFGLGKHPRRYALCCVIVVLCRADLGLAVAGLGALLWAEGRKTEGRISVVAGITYTALAVLVIQPHFGDGVYANINVFSAYGDSPVSVGWGMLTHPGHVLGDLFREQNFNLFVTLFAPVAFLPLLAPRYLLPVLPLEALFLIAHAPQDVVYGQQTVAITAFIFLATAFALARIGRMGVEKIIVDRRVLAALLLASTVFFIRDAASSPYRQPWDWGGRDAADLAKQHAADKVGPTAPVRASESMLMLLAERAKVYELLQGETPDAAGAADGVSAVILDDRDVAEWTAVDHQVFEEGMTSLGFSKVSSEEGIEVYVRNE